MPVVHAKSYKGIGLDKFIHKSRLKKIVNMLKNLKLAREGVWADFGCSDGFIFSCLREKLEPFNYWKLYGFDHDDRLLDLAKKRNLLNSNFIKFNLNKVSRKYQTFFDLVTCFETIEHTGNYKNAFENIYFSCKYNGYILISVPNEIGLPGIAKFIGRKVLRKNAYENFFKGSSALSYLAALIKGEDIEKFRDKNSEGWGPHLGFNYKNVEKYLFAEYIKREKCRLIKKDVSFLGFNILYVLKKLGSSKSAVYP